MSELTRRSFLKQSGATAAAAGALAVTPKALSRTTKAAQRPGVAGAAGTHRTSTKSSKATRTLVAHVPDMRKDKVRVLIGEREIVLRDRDLVARLARAAD